MAGSSGMRRTSSKGPPSSRPASSRCHASLHRALASTISGFITPKPSAEPGCRRAAAHPAAARHATPCPSAAPSTAATCGNVSARVRMSAPPMPLYRYKALNTRGETLDGQMEAASDAEVVLRLQEQGHLPVEARPASEGGGGSLKGLFRARPFSGERLVQFTQQLATLLGAGQPLDRALGILLDLPEDEGARRTIADVRDQVRGGTSLSAALER